VWQGDFLAGAATAAPIPAGSAGTFHRFTGTQDFNTLTAVAGQINLFWSDPLGASGNDYDLFRLNAAGSAVVGSSVNIQDGNDDPYEQMGAGIVGQRIVIVKKTGAAGRFLHLNTNGSTLSVATAGQIHGHAATSSASTFAVAATNGGIAGPDPFTTSDVVEPYSSDGQRRIFYHADGTPITPGDVSSSGGQVLQKPDVTAADHVLVSGAGPSPGLFDGTSAAAAHAAAIMALFKSQNPNFTNPQLRTLFLLSAIDIEAPGVDRDSGAGIAMAVAPQPGCTITTADSTINDPSPDGGTSNFPITTSSPSCSWVIFSNSPWLRVTSNVGVGNGNYLLSVAPNRGPARIGSLTIQGGAQVIVTQAGAAATTFNNVTPIALADPGTLESPLTVGGVTQTIANVTVSFYLTHTFDADLIISLVGPDGTVVKLSDQNGLDQDNYGSACSPSSGRTTFDDSVQLDIVHAGAPFSGSFRPEQPLSRFVGKAGAAANGAWKLRIQDIAGGDTGTLQCWSLSINQGPLQGVAGDFTGDGNAEFAVFRPATGQWFINGVGSQQFGLPGDVPVPGDYDGDGHTEAAVYRPATGQWFLSHSVPVANQFGRTGDIPVPADYDGDQRTDMAIYRTTDGINGVWFLNVPGQPPVPFGLRGDIPMPGDYDGDGRADLAVFRPSTGRWYVSFSTSAYTATSNGSWGLPGDIPVRGDFDRDGLQDLVVFRPSNATWYIQLSNAPPLVMPFGLPGDVPLAMDLNGDGVPELCVWRPSTGLWSAFNLVTSVTLSQPFGLPGDIPTGARPRLPSAPVSDFDGDGTSDITVFRPASGEWFTRYSASNFAGAASVQFGLNGDIRVNGDYDGDHRTDYAVYRPSTGQWFIRQSSNNAVRVASWGVGGDQPVPGDFDGDGRNDLAVWRPSTGEWFVINSSTGALAQTQWGLSGDQPFARDFDGDGRADLAVYRPSTSQWFVKLTTTAFGAAIVRTWGVAGDIPVPADLDGDGRTEIAVWRPSTGVWFAIDAITGALITNAAWGLPGDIAQPHDFDGDGLDDLAVFRPSNGTWYIRRSSNGALLLVSWGLSTDQPVVLANGRDR
jgi:subtilisin-like proprotein convertase family protein